MVNDRQPLPRQALDISIGFIPYTLLLLYNQPLPAGKEDVPSGGIVTGIGQVHGRAVAIVANDATGELQL